MQYPSRGRLFVPDLIHRLSPPRQLTEIWLTELAHNYPRLSIMSISSLHSEAQSYIACFGRIFVLILNSSSPVYNVSLFSFRRRFATFLGVVVLVDCILIRVKSMLVLLFYIPILLTRYMFIFDIFTSEANLKKRPMGHIAHLRKQFKSINTYDYIITLIKRRKKT